MVDLSPWYQHLVVKNGEFHIAYCQSSYWPIKWQIYPQVLASMWSRMVNFTLLLLELIVANQVVQIHPALLASSGQEWQFHIATVRAHIGQSSCRSTSQYQHLVVKNRNFTLLLLELILTFQVADLPGRSTPSYWHLVVKNGNLTLLLLELILARSSARSTSLQHLVVKSGKLTLSLLELILADQIADLPLHTNIQWSGMVISHCYCQSSYWQIKWHDLPPWQRHLMVKEWQFQIAIVKAHISRSSGRSTSCWYQHLVVKNGNFTLLLLELIQARSISRLTSPLLAIYWSRMVISHCYCQSSYWSIKWQISQQIYHLLLASSRQEWQFYISVVKAHIGRSSGRSTPCSSSIQWSRMVISHCYCQSSYWPIKQQIYPLILTSSHQEWQFHIATVRAHIGRSSGRSPSRSTTCYWHLVMKNGNLRFLLLMLI